MRGGWVRSLSKATPDQQAHPKSHHPNAPGIVDEMAESTCLLACDARVETQSLVIRHGAHSESVRAHEINASRANLSALQARIWSNHTGSRRTKAPALSALARCS